MLDIRSLSVEEISQITAYQADSLERADCADLFHDAIYARDEQLTASLFDLFVQYNFVYMQSIVTVQSDMSACLLPGELNDFAYLCDATGRSSTDLLKLFSLNF